MCVPMHGIERLLEKKKTIIHPAACLWGESGDVVQLMVLLKDVSPCSCVISEPECSLFVGERLRSAGSLSSLIRLKLSLQYFFGSVRLPWRRERSAANGHNCMGSFDIFVYLC